jgi:HAMP domain-containing protein
MSYSLAEAAARLEAAVERLAEAAGRVSTRLAAPPAGVPAEEVAALSARLEATIARLRAALPEGGELAEGDPEGDEEELPDEGEAGSGSRRPVEG